MHTRLGFFPLLRSFSSFKGCTTVTRSPAQSSLTVDLSEQLKDLPNKEHTVSLKVHVFKVNGSIPPIQVTSGDCSVEWLGKERKSLHAINAEYREYDGIAVKIKSGTAFSLSFGEGVYVDDVYGIDVKPTTSGNTASLKH